MNRRIDPGSAVTAFVLVAMLVVAVALSPKAKAPPPTPIEVLDSALKTTFSPQATADLQNRDQVLSIVMWRELAQRPADDSSHALAERIARYANAQYRGAPVEAISVRFMDYETQDGTVKHTRATFGGTFFPPVLDGRVTPVSVDISTFHALTPATRFIAARGDSLTIDPATLRPLEEWYGSSHVTYDGAHIHGSIDTTLAVAPFAAPELETIVHALPLAAGYAARFPLFQVRFGRGDLLWESIYVVGADSVCRCWQVNTVDPRIGFRRIQIPLKP